MLEVPALPHGFLIRRGLLGLEEGRQAQLVEQVVRAFQVTRFDAGREVRDDAEGGAGIELGRVGGQHHTDVLATEGIRESVLQASASNPRQDAGERLCALQIVEPVISGVLQRIHEDHLTLDVLDIPKQQPHALLLGQVHFRQVLGEEVHRRPALSESLATGFCKQRHTESSSPDAVERQGQEDAVVDFKGARHSGRVGRMLHGVQDCGESGALPGSPKLQRSPLPGSVPSTAR